MKIFLLLLLFLLSLGEFTSAQSEYKPVRFFYRPSVGAMFATRSFPTNDIAGNLIGTKFENVLCQPLAIGFFYQNIGIEGQVTLTPAQNPRNRHDQFIKDVNLKYGNKYHASVSSSAIDDYLNNTSDPMVRGSLGPSYKIERNRLILVGRMMMGIVSITNNSGRARLKEKGTNELLNIRWDSRHATTDCFSVHPSFTFAYRISRRITFNLDLDSWFYKADITYKETITNAVSHNITTNQYKYSHFMNDVSIGTGIMVIFK
jgi:hypothetical protein